MIRAAIAGVLLTLACVWAGGAIARDVLRSKQGDFADWLPEGHLTSRPCNEIPTRPPLSLGVVIEEVLCHDPLTRQAWAEARALAAQVGVARSAYLPRLGASSAITFARNHTNYKQMEDYSTEGYQRRLENRLNLSWVLFDFGRREATLRNAHQLLVAANASKDSQLQQTFMQVAQLYYYTLAAQDSQRAAQQVTALAAENLKDASAKYEAGAAALSDCLQAQTAYTQAMLSEVREQGVVRSAQGQIALRMGLPPETPITLTAGLARVPDRNFVDDVEALLAQASEGHPLLIAARAKLEAAKATVKQQEAAGRPSISFVASVSYAQAQQSAAYYGDSRIRDNSVGLQIDIPLFEGFERTYQVRSARARVDASKAELAEVEQRIALELWASYQALVVETQALETTKKWVEQAVQALQVVQGRYRSGVGSMTELLNATTAYASAEQQNIRTLNNWHVARLRLAASLGRLGFWTL
ncbi:Outer membrane protein TolC precursor [compost metagenome]|uniref:Protein CyaE n=1 Tax=Pseudomonas putida TaxID=303 RepID=A0A7D6A598_PSEPU|nr:TolC family protein [Pseudomonas putida]QLJ14521.1 TolC family protein [Pseudomonas putida]